MDHRSHKIIEILSGTLLTLIGADSPQSIAVAVSGGSDSMALCLLLHDWCNDRGILLTALTVDHGLRTESAQEAQQVAQWMEALKVPHHILSWNHHAHPFSGNMQAAAREHRYRLLTGYCAAHDIPFLCIGHTEDDQAETIALRQERQAGPVGLAGMSARIIHDTTTIIRPLLGLSREALRHYLRHVNQKWIDDPSNDNTDFDRIRIRQRLSAHPQEKTALLALGRQMAETRTTLERQAAQWFSTHLSATASPERLSFQQEALIQSDDALACYLLGRMLLFIGKTAYPPRYAPLEALLTQLRREPTGKATLNHCLVQWKKNEITLIPEPARQPASRRIYANPLVAPPFFPI